MALLEKVACERSSTNFRGFEGPVSGCVTPPGGIGLLPVSGDVLQLSKSAQRALSRVDHAFPGGRLAPHSFTGNGSRIPFLDAEFSYNFSYIRGFDP